MKIRSIFRAAACGALTLVGMAALVELSVTPFGYLDWYREWGSRETKFRSLELHVENNSLDLAMSSFRHNVSEDHRWRFSTASWIPSLGWLDVTIYSYFDRGFIRRGIKAPLWFIAVIAIPYPALVYRGMWRTRQRKRRGQCLKCGYDLTGNVTGKCSECGTASAPKAHRGENAQPVNTDTPAN